MTSQNDSRWEAVGAWGLERRRPEGGHETRHLGPQGWVYRMQVTVTVPATAAEAMDRRFDNWVRREIGASIRNVVRRMENEA